MALDLSHSLNFALASESAHAPAEMKTCNEACDFLTGRSTPRITPKQYLESDLQSCMASEALE